MSSTYAIVPAGHFRSVAIEVLTANDQLITAASMTDAETTDGKGSLIIVPLEKTSHRNREGGIKLRGSKNSK